MQQIFLDANLYTFLKIFKLEHILQYFHIFINSICHYKSNKSLIPTPLFIKKHKVA